MHATSRPLSLYHLHHPIVAMREAPRVVARAGATYGRGEILAIAVVEDSDPEIVAERIVGLRAKVERMMNEAGRLAVEAIPAPGDVGRSHRLLPWTEPEQQVVRLRRQLGKLGALDADEAAVVAAQLDAEAGALGEVVGDDEAPSVLACERTADALRALSVYLPLAARVREHRASYQGRRRAS